MDTVNELFEQLSDPDIHFLNEAEIYQAIIKSGYKQTELGKRLNKSQPSIANKLRMLNLSQACRTMVIANKLTERHVRALLKVQLEERRMKILLHVIEHGSTVKKMESYIANNYGAEAKNEVKAGLNLLFSSLKSDMKMLIRKGVKVKAKKCYGEDYTDILIRVYK